MRDPDQRQHPSSCVTLHVVEGHAGRPKTCIFVLVAHAAHIYHTVHNAMPWGGDLGAEPWGGDLGAEPTRCEVHGQHQTKFGFTSITLNELDCLIFACTGQYLAIPFPRSSHIEAATVAPQQLTHHFNSSAFL
jgi:hypothetical protein